MVGRFGASVTAAARGSSPAIANIPSLTFCIVPMLRLHGVGRLFPDVRDAAPS